MTEATSSDDKAGGAAGASVDGAGGAAEQPWYAALPEDIRENPTLVRYASVEDAGRALISATGRLGLPPEQLIRLPKPDDAEGQAALWNKVGRPEKADGYGEIKLPEGSPLDQSALQGFLATMHKSGPFTPAMAEAATRWYGDFGKQVEQAATDAIQAVRTQNEAALKGEWGAAYGQNLAAAAAAAERFGGRDFRAFVDASGMGDDPRFLKAWKGVADAMGEAGAAPSERGRDAFRGVMTPAEAKAARMDLESRPETSKALLDANNPNHEHVVQRRLELIRLENPSPEKT